jgi:hypothetical protein
MQSGKFITTIMSEATPPTQAADDKNKHLIGDGDTNALPKLVGFKRRREPENAGQKNGPSPKRHCANRALPCDAIPFSPLNLSPQKSDAYSPVSRWFWAMLTNGEIPAESYRFYVKHGIPMGLSDTRRRLRF